MKKAISWLLILVSASAIGQTLPVITSSPTNVTVNPGSTATFTVAASGATSYQWIFQGTNIPGATGAILQVANAQSTNCGYYLALAKNATGWVPSQMAYLTLDYTYGGLQPTACGTLPFSSTNDTYFQGDIEDASGSMLVPNNGTVQIISGPELDQMTPIGQIIHYRTSPTSNRFYNGYYNAPDQLVSTIFPGQTVYYSVIGQYTNSSAYVQPSTIMHLQAGASGTPAPSSYGLKFPEWFALEGVEPEIYYTPSITNQLRVAGETFSLSFSYFAYNDYGNPTVQWRKNGVAIPNATNTANATAGPATLTITNALATDAGIYDLIIYGSEWVVSPKITISVQTANGAGILQSPKLVSSTNFVCNLVGAAGRNYQVLWSTNLMTWTNLTTLTNTSGTVTFTNPISKTGAGYYRTVLLP